MARRTRKPDKAKRVTRGTKRRSSGSAARAHPKTGKRSLPARRPPPVTGKRPGSVRKHPPKLRSDPRIEAAVRAMNRGRSLTAAARESHVSPKRLRNYLLQQRLAKRKGQRWVTKDNRPRRLPVMTGGRFRVLTVRGYEPARLVGEHHHAVGEFVRTNALEFIEPFTGRSMQAINGRRYVLETDPNALHRIAAMDSPPFHEIYEITSNT